MNRPEAGGLTSEDFRQLAEEHMGEGGLFVYEIDKLEAAADLFMGATMPYGHTPRYAIKANSEEPVIDLFNSRGLHFDASSIGEARLLESYGVETEKISLSAQMWDNEAALEAMLARGLKPVATSRRQLARLGEMGCRQAAVRFNPEAGVPGHNKRTTVAGPNSGFGIWHEKLDEVQDIAGQAGVTIDRLHIHTGSGGEKGVEAWRSNILRGLAIAARLPDVATFDIGGGYKAARMPDEEASDMEQIFKVFAEELINFQKATGREIKLETEPGTILVANAVSLITRVMEIEDTPLFNFPRLNAGMNANARFITYGARHPIEVLTDATAREDNVFIGPACESGDNLCPQDGNPEEFEPREVIKPRVGDYARIGGAGAYTVSMSPRQYCQTAEPTSIFV